jgi:hypothetical protein
MTVLNESNTELLSELELGARKPRKVQVRRQTQGTVEERLASAKLDQAVVVAVGARDREHENRIAELRDEHARELENREQLGYELGATAGRSEAAAEYDDSFDDQVNSRVCDRERRMPWSVGVVIAGEQHRILQALADWLDGKPARDGKCVMNVQEFARIMKMPYFPEYTAAPDPITRHNCEEPPAVARNEGFSIAGDNFSPFWKYYLEQLNQD